MQEFNPKQYLAISIANHFGKDKLTWDERIQWVKDNYDSLEDLINEADAKPLYLKAVKALRDTDKGIPTGYLMDLDATSSGYQIMSILANDLVGMENTNVIENDSDTRMDIYGSIARIMTDMVGEEIPRSLVKKPIMTVGYGSKLQPAILFGDGTPESEAFYKALYTMLPGAMGVMQVLRNCWDESKIEHTWTLPDKHKVVLPSTQMVDSKIESDELNQVFTYRHEVMQPHDRGTNIIANIVHSIDGWIAREMVRMAHRQGFTCTHIHDSFWFHPMYGNHVRKNYNAILANLCRSKYFERVTEEITRVTQVRVSDTQENVEKILEANYSLS